jgi:hypothetical protein
MTPKKTHTQSFAHVGLLVGLAVLSALVLGLGVLVLGAG